MKHQHPNTPKEDLDNVIYMLKDHLDDRTISIVVNVVTLQGSSEFQFRYGRECRPLQEVGSDKF